MKLQDLAAPQKTRQVAKVMESYFGQSISFESISKRQAHNMLTRVRGLISEHRRQPEFHSSEQNPAYLKLVMMEQALASKLSEEVPVAPGTVAAIGTSSLSLLVNACSIITNFKYAGFCSLLWNSG